MEFENIRMRNAVLKEDYALKSQPYEYLFFRIPEEQYPYLESISMEIRVFSTRAALVLNQYRQTKPLEITGSTQVVFGADSCEAGENILAYKGEIQVGAVEFHLSEKTGGQELSGPEPKGALKAAGQFLLCSRIPSSGAGSGAGSRFDGSCFAIYDYTNQCHRMPCWLWSDAPVVSAALKLADSGLYPEKKEALLQLAYSIGEVFLNTQILDEGEESYGALVSRYRYYGKKEYSFNCLLGMNDTSYSVRWALLPLYEYTKDNRYRTAAARALDWVEKNVYNMEFVPSHYYFENKEWEPKAFVDTGFCADGFAMYQQVVGDRDYRQTIRFITDRFLKQFSLGNGYFGQNYVPGRGVDDRLFTRGHGWVLEGLLACIKAVGDVKYQETAKALIHKLVAWQAPDGSFPYLLGYGWPADEERNGSGVCEKATAILAYLFLEYDSLCGDEKAKRSGEAALAWCEKNMCLTPGPGYGGIHSASLSSGITGLPYLEVATGYANAYYIMGVLCCKSNKFLW